jgi:hypothetical protein
MPDLAMSLDNVVALAAIARGDFWLKSVGASSAFPSWRADPERNRSPRARPSAAFAPDGPAASARGWTEERVAVAGLVLLAFIAGHHRHSLVLRQPHVTRKARFQRRETMTQEYPAAELPRAPRRSERLRQSAGWMYFVEEMTRSPIEILQSPR